MKELHSEITRNSQNIVYTSLVQIGRGRYKVRIVSNAYEDQSYAKIERWDGERWNLVHCIDGLDGLKTQAGLYVRGNPSIGGYTKDFEADRDRLVEFAKLAEGE